jgi:hypothetical protein
MTINISVIFFKKSKLLDTRVLRDTDLLFCPRFSKTQNVRTSRAKLRWGSSKRDNLVAKYGVPRDDTPCPWWPCYLTDRELIELEHGACTSNRSTPANAAAKPAAGRRPRWPAGRMYGGSDRYRCNQPPRATGIQSSSRPGRVRTEQDRDEHVRR